MGAVLILRSQPKILRKIQKKLRRYISGISRFLHVWWSVSWVLGFGLFIPDYKVPDLTSGVEFGGDGPAFADNVIVVEGCFLRISIEGLKV